MLDPQVIEDAKKMLIALDKAGVAELTEKIIADGGNSLELMDKAFIPALNDVGKLFSRGKMFLPELVQAADAMKAATDLVDKALIGTGEVKGEIGTVVVATVKGDVHDIGKCIVVSLFKANGFTVHDLGRDVAVDTIIEAAVKVDADVIGTSALLTTTMTQQITLEEALRSAGLRDRFKTMVGGAPVTPRWAARIGADAYAADAQDGVNKVKEMLAA
ncbi:MAG: cobalamin-dependent protein [Deltaproteobacteria bacterium]|nr:cobalamin-dependent protein [Deltaproteobacteria bacterium]MBW2176358.1 cobalamin-dependent protein [Deltaproteobacteria bacterium]MBW2296603.1 cobalamin-dependent protein [Deltaproteobacteria bacterium]